MRRNLVIAALVVGPLLAVIGVAALGSSGGDEDASADRTTTTVGGGPAADDGAGGPAPSEGTTDAGVEPPPGPSDPAPAEDAPADETPVEPAPATTVPATTEVPSPPGVAGVEGDRPVTTYPQPTVPDGGCPRRDGTVLITLGDRPTPGCVSVGASQTIEFANRTGAEISLVAEGVNEVVAAGGSFSIGATAFPAGRSTFWSPGNPDLSGIVELRA